MQGDSLQPNSLLDLPKLTTLTSSNEGNTFRYCRHITLESILPFYQ